MSMHKGGRTTANTGGATGLRSGGPTTQNTGGSMAFTENTPKSKSPSMGGSSDAKKLGKVSAGKIETMRGKNVR